MSERLQEFDSSVPPISRRGRRAGVNGRLFDALHRHRHFLLRAENGIIRDMARPLVEARNELTSRIATVAAGAGASDDLSRLPASRLSELGRTIRRLLAEAEVSSERIFGRRLDQLAEKEAEFQARLLDREVPEEVEIDTDVPPRTVSVAVGQQTMGKRWPERHRGNVAEAAVQAERQLQGGAALQETVSRTTDAVKRAVDKAAVSAVAFIGRTEVQAVANRIARAMYARNERHVKMLQRVETLDDRTCLICASIDGTTVPVTADDSELAPFHPSCRGFTVPVLRSWEEMGLPAVDLRPEVRQALDGEVPGSVDYRDWFADQPDSFKRRVLGPGRFRLLQSGELEITDFVRSGRILPLAELPDVSMDALEN